MKGRTNVFIAITLLAMLAQMGMTVDSNPGYHGFGDCALCHNEPVTAYNSTYMDAEITLDGIKTEGFWNDYYGRRTMVLVAGNFGANRMMFSLFFAQNSTHIFVAAQWEDHTSEGSATERGTTPYDGVSIMWNIAGDNFNDEYFSGMKHPGGAGSLADTWTWKANAPFAFNATGAGSIYDNAFDDRGWVDDETQDLMAYAKYGYIENHAESDYFVEMVRPLVTDDANDIQFEETGFYTFDVALWNNSFGASHLMGFTHEVFVVNGDPTIPTETVTETVTNTETVTETKTETPVQIGMFVFSILAVSVIVMRKRK